ncbi:response regulator transcription factor [Winogradskyella sp. DF17]|uniref:Response regulator transcription factor n=1 Tax=Winogradskyella pelagia TaxID=2819984 RepID=A0ABS3T5C0_9FLAO|nr:response regulator transcription factor [Winogradskyella sp. DF17]MBO3117946.1 response regulator transcription factor [Winogradskyella sp. DF17]
MKAKILIVEDEGLIAEDIKYQLEELGHTVFGIVMNGDRALDAIANPNLDLVLLDINIKGSLSGIDLAKIIKEKYKIPYVFLTASTDDETLNKAKNTLPYGYIVKPFNKLDLKVNIDVALHKFNSEKEKLTLSRNYVLEKFNIPLSDREFDLLKAFVTGLSYKEAAEKLHISVNTVKSYQKRIYQLFDVSSKVELIKKVG